MRSLANCYLYAGYVHFVVEPALDLAGRSRFKKQFQRLLQVVASLIHRIALAGDVQLWAEGYVARSFPFDYCRQMSSDYYLPVSDWICSFSTPDLPGLLLSALPSLWVNIACYPHTRPMAA